MSEKTVWTSSSGFSLFLFVSASLQSATSSLLISHGHHWPLKSIEESILLRTLEYIGFHGWKSHPTQHSGWFVFFLRSAGSGTQSLPKIVGRIVDVSVFNELSEGWVQNSVICLTNYWTLAICLLALCFSHELSSPWGGLLLQSPSALTQLSGCFHTLSALVFHPGTWVLCPALLAFIGLLMEISQAAVLPSCHTKLLSPIFRCCLIAAWTTSIGPGTGYCESILPHLSFTGCLLLDLFEKFQ